MEIINKIKDEFNRNPIIFSLLILVVIYLITKNTIEKFTATSAPTSSPTSSPSSISQENLRAIDNLAKIAKSITNGNGNLTIPGNLTVSGNINGNGKLDINGKISSKEIAASEKLEIPNGSIQKDGPHTLFYSKGDFDFYPDNKKQPNYSVSIQDNNVKLLTNNIIASGSITSGGKKVIKHDDKVQMRFGSKSGEYLMDRDNAHIARYPSFSECRNNNSGACQYRLFIQHSP